MRMVSSHSQLLAATVLAATLVNYALAHEASIEVQVAEAVRGDAALRVQWRDAHWKPAATVPLKLLGINDFHGQLLPLQVGTRPVGGAAVLLSYLRDAKARAPGDSVVVHAGDHIGTSPPNSALLHDEPSISLLNLLADRRCLDFSVVQQIPLVLRPWAEVECNVVGTFGNHEFDDGRAELQRLLEGGNHTDGPFLENPWKGARFPYVASNVIDVRTNKPIVAPYTVKLVGTLTGPHVLVGIIGSALAETPTIVTPSGVAGLRFDNEADAINRAARELVGLGIRTIIVTIHQGTRQPAYEGPTDLTTQVTLGPIVDTVQRLDDSVDVVISGHAHSFTNTLIPNAHGKPILVTQAFNAGTAFADIDLTIDRHTWDVVEKSASIVTTWADQGPGLAPDPDAQAIVLAANQTVGPLITRVIGNAAVTLTRVESPAGESALGNLVADAQRVSTGAQFAFVQPGALRADLQGGEVTWGELFAVHPFGNDLVSMDLTGAQIQTLLEQQWINQATPRLLKISGLTYIWDAQRPIGTRIVEILDDRGGPLQLGVIYRVAVNSFLAGGGDNFLVLAQGTNRVVGDVDLNALITYLTSLPQPFIAPEQGRVQRTN